MSKLRRSLALLGALLVVSVAPPVAGADSGTGGVYVATIPAGADIWLDGTYVGRSPVAVDGLAGGHHAITITKTGWSVRELDVEVVADKVVVAGTELIAEPHAGARSENEGDLSLRGLDPGMKVLLDGAPLSGEVRRPIPLLAGAHHLAITTASGEVTRTFHIWPDTTTEVIVHAPAAGEGRSAVVAPAEDYLPAGSFTLEGAKIVVHYGGHTVVAHIGEVTVRYDGVALTYDGAPQTIAGRLYLPLELLEKLTAGTSKDK